MVAETRNKALFVAVLIVLAVCTLLPSFFRDKMPEWWPTQPLKLGLDLKGGSYIVLGVQVEEAVKSELNAIARSLKSELRKEKAGVVRARSVGAREVEITLLGDRGIQIVKDTVRQDFEEIAFRDEQRDGDRTVLTFAIPEAEAGKVKENAVEQAIETIRNRVDQFGVAEPTIQRLGQAQIMVQLPDVTNIQTVKETIGSVAKLEFRFASDEATGGPGTISVRSREGGRLIVEDEVSMSGDAIKTANVDINPTTNEVEVTLRLNSFGASLFDRITSENVGRRLAIILDGVVQSSPVIRERISGGTAQISGSFTPDEAHRLAIVLRSGALPAPLTFEEERTVGAALGADSINKGVSSILVGSAIVVLFMLLYYRKAGILAVTCLACNLFFLMALLSLLGATLTLPGIAGLALTIGMAVDANVIIYERLREESRQGLRGRVLITSGYEKVHWTILDANITTLLTALILYGFGTGPIKGFAVTLSLGILTSVFTALYISRLGFEIFKFQKSDGSLSI